MKFQAEFISTNYGLGLLYRRRRCYCWNSLQNYFYL